MAELTTDRILTLAPDAASAASARSLASPARWAALHADHDVLWGHCQGSGKTPYLTSVDRAEPGATRCTCPSRKFPCKHALALLLLRAQQPDAFGADPAPEPVRTWMTGRTARAAA
ncbi:SWIM zinc finger family protein, partial [Deinococcus pimensis]|uniref:SWIM zinc finger family protein n=1 Tax=Deinococcus pimensis TaxID=309888 RepID=UPI00048A2FD1